jgi:hypothetical protein
MRSQAFSGAVNGACGTHSAHVMTAWTEQQTRGTQGMQVGACEQAGTEQPPYLVRIEREQLVRQRGIKYALAASAEEGGKSRAAEERAALVACRGGGATPAALRSASLWGGAACTGTQKHATHAGTHTGQIECGR